MGERYGASSFGFEDLEAYKAARALCNKAYRLAKTLPEAEKYGLVPQMRKAAVSITNNIAEGYGRFTWQDTAHFCRQARGSLMELVDDLSTCQDQQYAPPALIEELKTEAARVLKLLNGYIRYLQRGKNTPRE